MRIAIVSHYFPDVSFSGTEIYCYNIAAELQSRGHDVYIIHRSYDSNKPEAALSVRMYKGLPVIMLNSWHSVREFSGTYSDERFDALFSRILDGLRPDLVHFNHLYQLSVGFLEVVWRQRIPSVFTLHDYWMICDQIHLHKKYDICSLKSPHDCSECAAKNGLAVAERDIEDRDRLFRSGLAKVDRVLSPSRFLQNKFAEMSQWSEVKIDVLPNGVMIPPGPERELKKSFGKEGRLIFGYFGHILYPKGLHILLQAFATMDQASYGLYIRGKIETAYGAFLDESFPWWRRFYAGEYINTDVYDLMVDNVDVVVFPSVIYENQPTLINECKVAKLPVIASDSGGSVEMIDHGKTGWLVKAGDPSELQSVMSALSLETLQAMRPALASQKVVSVASHVDTLLEDVYFPLTRGAATRIPSPLKILELWSEKEASLMRSQPRSVDGCYSVLFIDSGAGFREQECIRCFIHLEKENDICVEFDLSEQPPIKGLRWDPVDSVFSRLLIENATSISVNGDRTELSIEKMDHNGVSNGGGWISFFTLDPRIILPVPAGLHSVQFRFRWAPLEPIELQRALAERSQLFGALLRLSTAVDQYLRLTGDSRVRRFLRFIRRMLVGN